MKIETLKASIESGSVGCGGLIFKSSTTFVPLQYISKIAEIYKKEIEFVDSESRLIKQNSLFGDAIRSKICVLITKEFTSELDIDDFCYVICDECKNNSAVLVPKLESWHLLDYAITNSSKNIGRSYIEALVKASKGNPYLIENEIAKYNIFSDSDQNRIFKSLSDNNQLLRSYDETIFDFTNAILNKDINTIIKVYSNLSDYSIDAMAIISVIRKQLRNIILVGFNRCPTEENTGLSSKQIYWIKKNLGKYEAQSLVDSFTFICSAPELLKKGVLSSNQLLDYVLVKLL